MSMRISYDIWGRIASRMAVLLLALSPMGLAYAEYTPFPDNDARAAILKERLRVDAIQIEFDKLRNDAKVFRTEGEAIRREADILRRDLNAVQANLDLMIRKVDAKIDDGIKPFSESVRRSGDEIQVLKIAQQDLLAQLEIARKEVSELRGQIEESQAQSGRQRSQIEELRALKGRQDDQQQAVLEEQRKSKELQRALDELRSGLPILVNEDGSNFFAQSSEKAEFDNAKAVFKRATNYAGARNQFAEFLLRYPRGGYAPAARFWKGNTEFLLGQYKSALLTLRPLQIAEPNYKKTPEAMLVIANCYLELKDMQAARNTLEELMEQYERSEEAVVARDRLTKLQ